MISTDMIYHIRYGGPRHEHAYAGVRVWVGGGGVAWGEANRRETQNTPNTGIDGVRTIDLIYYR